MFTLYCENRVNTCFHDRSAEIEQTIVFTRKSAINCGNYRRLPLSKSTKVFKALLTLDVYRAALYITAMIQTVRC